MRKILLIAIMVLIGQFAKAQETEPILLKYPENWRFERIDFPIEFAPEIEYEGFEELRFSPQMFSKGEDYYFTYIFAIFLEKKKELSISEIEKFLTQYFRGLCSVVASSKKQEVNTDKINVKANKNGSFYTIKVDYIDTFTDGSNVQLHMEVEEEITSKGIQLTALVSPQPNSHHVWDRLHEIKKNLKIK